MRKVYKIILILLDRNSLYSAHLLSDSTHANLFEKTRTHLYIQSNLEILTSPTHSSYLSHRYLISKMPSDSDNEVTSINTVSCRLFEVPIIRNFNIFSHEFTRKYLSYQCRRNPGLRKRQKCVPANFSGSSFAWSTLVTNLIHYCVLKDPVFFYELMVIKFTN